MSERQHVSIKINAAGHGTVEIDGAPMNARSIKVDAAVGSATIVTLELINVDLDAEIEGIVTDDCEVTAHGDSERRYAKP